MFQLLSNTMVNSGRRKWNALSAPTLKVIVQVERKEIFNLFESLKSSLYKESSQILEQASNFSLMFCIKL